MDEFLSYIYTSVFKKWILSSSVSGCQIFIDHDKNHIIHIQNNNYDGQIIFNDMNIIELTIINRINHEIEFYLHFQMSTLNHAIELFQEMIDCMHSLIQQPTIKVLLSCSGGLTTSFFASKINEAFAVLNFHYEASAIGYTQLFDAGENYDIILLAPQISYLQAKVQSIFKDKAVLSIPPQIFATYDVGAIIQLIVETIKQKKKIHTNHYLPLHKPVHFYKKILVLSIIRNSQRVHVIYRLYDTHQNIILQNEIIKPQLDINDIYDVIDTVLVSESDIDIIGLSLPGIINFGTVVSTNIHGFHTQDLLQSLEKRYTQTFVLGNDVDTAAIGYYVSQSQYENIAVLFQPTHFHAGVGMILNGQLYTGYQHLVGEVQYLPLHLSDDSLVLSRSPEGALELVSKTIACIMSLLAPETIVLFCTMIPNEDELKDELRKYIPSHYIPPIIILDHLEEYTLLGQMILCTQQHKLFS